MAKRPSDTKSNGSARFSSLASELRQPTRSDRLGRWDWKVESNELEWSAPIYRIFGVAPESFGGNAESFFDMVHPDDRALVEEEVRLALEEGKPYSVYHRVVRPDGEERMVHEQAEVIRGDDGRPLFMRGTVEDLTELHECMERSRLLELALRSSITPIVLLDSRLRFTYANPACLKLLGAADESELIGKAGVPMASPPERARAAANALMTVGHWEGDLSATRIDGSTFPLHLEASRIHTAGREEEFVASFIDLTDLRRTETELRNREAELNHVLSSIDVVIYRDWFRCGEVDARPGYISLPIERLAGVTPAELAAHPEIWFDLVHNEDREAVRETLRQARITGSPAVMEYRLKNRQSGGTVWVEESLATEVGDEGSVTGIFGTLRDITEQKESQRERAQFQSRLRTVAREWTQTFDAIAAPILLVRWSGTIRRVNRAAAALVDGEFGALVDHSLDEFDQSEPWRSASELVMQTRETGTSGFREVRNREDGKSWQVLVRPAVPEDRSKPRWLVVIFVDVSEVNRLQEVVRQNEKMSAMGALVARVAHEVRNPLFGISATVDALNAEHGAEPGLVDYLKVLRGEIDRMGRVMEDLLDYSRPVALKIAPSSLETLIERAVASCGSLAQGGGVALEAEVADGLPLIEVDGGKMQQVLQNLIENAIQHSPPGATVRVRGAADEEAGGVVAAVEDEGPGFPDGDLERVLEPFYSRRSGGTGLGLWIVKRVLLDHGGDLRLWNRDEGGAVVEVSIPWERKSSLD